MRARMFWFPFSGFLFTHWTIQKMARMAAVSARDPDMRAIAERAVGRDLPSKDYRGECARLFRFVKENVRYLQDPRGVEWLTWPKKLLLEVGQEDCESMCALLACLWLCLGHEAGYRAVKADTRRPNEYSHVFCVVRLGNGQPWLPADPTELGLPFGADPTRGRHVWGQATWAIDAERDKAVRERSADRGALAWAR